MYVPQECFYLRCGRVKNYMWVRNLMMHWGGNLEQIVATAAVDADVRSRIERQLALNPEAALALSIDDAITDCALIGCDTYFHDGAAGGVIFEAKRDGDLADIIDQQRKQIAAATEAVRQVVVMGGTKVSLLSTPDNVVRSYYAIRDGYHLVTNSRYMASRFVEAASGMRPLGALKEFRYAKGKLPVSRGHVALLYLSDPFFRNLTSPSFRIEMARRTRAANELRSLRLAQMAAQAEGRSANSIDALIRDGYLPITFGRSPDGSRPVRRDDRFVDSLRGAKGTFLPVVDVNVTRVTRGEIRAFGKFNKAYMREWRAMDPVVVAFSESVAKKSGDL